MYALLAPLIAIPAHLTLANALSVSRHSPTIPRQIHAHAPQTNTRSHLQRQTHAPTVPSTVRLVQIQLELAQDALPLFH